MLFVLVITALAVDIGKPLDVCHCCAAGILSSAVGCTEQVISDDTNGSCRLLRLSASDDLDKVSGTSGIKGHSRTGTSQLQTANDKCLHSTLILLMMLSEV